MNNPVKLSLLELESYLGQGRGKPSGKYLRYFCPIHGSDHQRSLSLNPDTGYFKCFACGAWGYLEREKRDWKEQNRKHALQRTTSDRCIEAPNPDLKGLLREFQAALPGSPGEEYLEKRRIPLELAQTYGAGYAAPGKWPNRGRKWKYGHIVFPHTDPAGEVVNLYARAVDTTEEAPKELRHAHLPGTKGIFNAPALSGDAVFICEGVFDALSMIAAGYKDACAVFGVDGLRWEWVTARRVVFCFDHDTAGERWKQQAWDGILRGKKIFYLPKEIYASYKDLSEVWVATGKLDIGEWNDISDNIKTPIQSDNIKTSTQSAEKELIQAIESLLINKPLLGGAIELTEEMKRALRNRGLTSATKGICIAMDESSYKGWKSQRDIDGHYRIYMISDILNAFPEIQQNKRYAETLPEKIKELAVGV
jgi:hypothetical protein